MSSEPSSQAASTKRVLACVLCQNRKVKCDRKFPCANCSKVGAKCIPAGLIPRQRRKRFPERELLERLRRYESLLRHNNIAFEPLHAPSSTEQFTTSTQDYMNDSSELSSKVQAVTLTDFPSNHLEQDNEVPRSETINIWRAMNQRSQSSSDEEETDQDEYGDGETSQSHVHPSTVKKALAPLFEDDDGKFLFGSRIDIDLSTLHPEQVQIFKLWQVYLENVDPLLKITHSPTLQTRIIDAATNLEAISPALEALMFSIYCVSILTLPEDDCVSFFGKDSKILLAGFQLGCQQALLRSQVLRTSDLDCLTALFFYLSCYEILPPAFKSTIQTYRSQIAFKPYAEPRSLSTTLGVAVRLAQHMGLHSETVNAKYTALEAEMRRRLWWSLVHLDNRVSEMSDFRCSVLAPTWDCKTPANIGDFDLRPEMKHTPPNQGNITEAIFSVVRSEIADFTRYSSFWLDFTNPLLKSLARPFPKLDSSDEDELGYVEKTIQDRYLKSCNPENPLHFMTIWMARGYIAKNRLLAHYARHARASAKQSDAQRDTALGYALTLFECDTLLLTSPLTKSFLWFTMTILQFPFQAYIHVVQDLRRRPAGRLAEKGWKVMSDNYSARFTNWLGNVNPLASIISKVVLQAWEARKSALGIQDSGPAPGIVEAMSSTQSEGSNSASNDQKLPGFLQKLVTDCIRLRPAPQQVSVPMQMPMGLDPVAFDISNSFAQPDLLTNVTDSLHSSVGFGVEPLDWGDMDWTWMSSGVGGEGMQGW